MRTYVLLSTISLLVTSAQSLAGQEAAIAIGDPTKNAGKVQWTPMQIETGDVPFGIPVEGTIEAKNISSDTLHLLEVWSSCHCTVAEWTKEPIPPGGSGFIRVVFDAQKEGVFYKVIGIRTNFDPETQLALGMTGRVLPQKAKKP